MSIREHMRRFHQRVTRITVIVGVVTVLLFTWRYPHASGTAHYELGAVMGVVIGVVLLFVFRGRFVCPRCGADFLKLRRKERGRFNFDTRMFWQIWDKCPHCGVSFDDPWASHTQDPIS